MVRRPLRTLDSNRNRSPLIENFKSNSKRSYISVPDDEDDNFYQVSSESSSCSSSVESCDPYLHRSVLRTSQCDVTPTCKKKDASPHTFLGGRKLSSSPYLSITDDPYLDEAGSFNSDDGTEITKETYNVASTERYQIETSFSLESVCTNEAIGDRSKQTCDIKMVPTEVHITSQKEPSVSETMEIPKPRILTMDHERNFWNIQFKFYMHAYGMIDTRTLEITMNLANAYLRCKNFDRAITIYQTAVGICREIHHDAHVSLAKPLDKVGMVICWSSNRQQHLESALVALQHAFMIRYKILGPHHVDTVDSLNNLAGFYLCLDDLNTALEMYYEVWVLRQAIYGKHHPSVAVTAQALGEVCSRLSQFQQALYYFYNAKGIYEYLSISNQNPNMIRLIESVAVLERKTKIVDAGLMR